MLVTCSDVKDVLEVMLELSELLRAYRYLTLIPEMRVGERQGLVMSL